jgi:superfamily II DNA/RNA helicase
LYRLQTFALLLVLLVDIEVCACMEELRRKPREMYLHSTLKFEFCQILQKGIHIVVATPGRLLDLISEGYCNLGQVSFLVLDEADRMLVRVTEFRELTTFQDMGFEKPIRAILKVSTSLSFFSTI